MSEDRSDHTFLFGFLTGALVGAGLALWFAPRAGSELRRQLAEKARNLSNRASEQYQQAPTRVDEAVDESSQKSQRVGEEVANAVPGGAHEVERIAKAARPDVGETRTRSKADRAVPASPSL